jgi:hypothetical protein
VPVLYDVARWPTILPRTRRVDVVGVGRAGEVLLQLEQGAAVFHGTYVTRMRHDEVGPAHIVRMWLDARYPHAIDDAYGWLSVEPYAGGRSLVTTHVLVDLGPGVIRWLLEAKVRAMVLALPAAVRRHVESAR